MKYQTLLLLDQDDEDRGRCCIFCNRKARIDRLYTERAARGALCAAWQQLVLSIRHGRHKFDDQTYSREYIKSWCRTATRSTAELPRNIKEQG